MRFCMFLSTGEGMSHLAQAFLQPQLQGCALNLGPVLQLSVELLGDHALSQPVCGPV
jgi:hypothetical protein